MNVAQWLRWAIVTVLALGGAAGVLLAVLVTRLTLA